MSDPIHLSAGSAVVEGAQRRHATALRSYVGELEHGERERTEAILAETWNALGAQPDPVEDAKLGVWLFAEARRRAGVGTRGLVSTDEFVGESGENAEEGSAESSFAALTPKQREVLRLKFVHGFRHEEIAQIVELSSAQAARLLHNALARLRPAFRAESSDSAEASDDPRLTLAALGELDDAARLAWEAGQPGRVRGPERMEEVRRAARWVAARLTQGGARRTAPRRRWRRGWPVVMVLAGIAVVGVWLWPRRETVDEARTASAPREKRSHDVSMRGTDVTSRPPEADGGGRRGAAVAGEDRQSLGVVRERELAAPKGSVAPTNELARVERAETREPIREPIGHSAPSLAPPAERRGVSDPRPIAAPPARAMGESDSREVPPANLDAPAQSSSRAAPSGSTSMAAPIASTDVSAITSLKRALGQGAWPRLQEVERASLQRYFARRPSSSVPVQQFAATIEAAELPWAPGKVAVRVAATARPQPTPPRPRATLVFLLDVSASMLPSNRLPLVQEAVAGVIERLRPEDRVGWVTYAAEVQARVPPAPVGEPRAWRERLQALTAHGQTNGGAGLEAALALASGERDGGPAIVLLCTDGEFNVGATTEEELAALVQRHAAEGVRLAVFGFGRNGEIDPRLETLALLAQGGSGYVNTRAEAVTTLLRQLGELVRPSVEAVELQCGVDGDALPPRRVAKLLPGETVAEFAVVGPTQILAARLAYDATGSPERVQQALAWTGEVREVSETSADFRFAAGVARLEELLSREEPPHEAECAELEAWVRTVAEDAGGYRAELLALLAQLRAARSVTTR